MPNFDQVHDYSAGLTGPVCGGFDIVPDDQADIEQMTRAIMVGTSGDVSVVLKNGTTLLLAGLMTGVIYPFRISRVNASGTTATGIKGLV